MTIPGLLRCRCCVSQAGLRRRCFADYHVTPRTVQLAHTTHLQTLNTSLNHVEIRETQNHVGTFLMHGSTWRLLEMQRHWRCWCAKYCNFNTPFIIYLLFRSKPAKEVILSGYVRMVFSESRAYSNIWTWRIDTRISSSWTPICFDVSCPNFFRPSLHLSHTWDTRYVHVCLRYLRF